MYAPKAFDEGNMDSMLELIQSYPFATLVTAGVNGLNAEHIPFLVKTEGDEIAVLQAHIAYSNPLWESCVNGDDVLVVFQGVNSYISPNWYPSKSKDSKVVPTWNYTAVHVKGSIEFIHDSEWKLLLLNDLTEKHEKGQDTPWAMRDAPAEFIDKLLPAIVGIEINVSSIQGKSKLSQNQSIENRKGVKDGLEGIGHKMAGLIKDS